VTPNELLGLAADATPGEAARRYRILVQIFHPDRFVTASEEVRREAERQMKLLNEAYAAIRQGRGHLPMPTGAVPGRANPPRRRPGAASRLADQASFERAARARRRAAARARAARRAEEQRLPHGQAVERPKPRTPTQVVLFGLGEALVTNSLRCRSCGAVQHLPPGWRERLQQANYVCSFCDSLLLCR
jgi:hypothetical protein